MLHNADVCYIQMFCTHIDIHHTQPTYLFVTLDSNRYIHGIYIYVTFLGARRRVSRHTQAASLTYNQLWTYVRFTYAVLYFLPDQAQREPKAARASKRIVSRIDSAPTVLLLESLFTQGSKQIHAETKSKTHASQKNTASQHPPRAPLGALVPPRHDATRT